MSVHNVLVSRETTDAIYTAKPANVTLLDFEAAILAQWATRWASATQHKRQKMIDSLRITPGEQDAIS